MSKLLILGAGGHGKVVAEAALLMKQWDEIAFLDDRAELVEVLGFKVIGPLKDCNFLKEKYPYAFVATGNNKLRLEWINNLLNLGYKVPVIKHPKSVISNFSIIGEGTAVMAGAIVNASSIIGRGCILNTNCSIDHDCILEDGVHISPGAYVGGTVKIGACTWVCIGSCIKNNVSIGRDSIIAAGAIVINDIPDGALAAGVPAIIKKNGEKTGE